MKTTENLLILDFMGIAPKWDSLAQSWYYRDCVFFHSFDSDRERVLKSMAEYAKYSTSWDWLMPVVEKIESLEYDVEIGTTYVRIARSDDSGFGLDEWFCGPKIEAVFDACVSLAKWYKNQPK